MGFWGRETLNCSISTVGEGGRLCKADPDISGPGVRALKACHISTDILGHRIVSIIDIHSILFVVVHQSVSYLEYENR